MLIFKIIGFFLLILLVFAFKSSQATRAIVTVAVIAGLVFLVVQSKKK